MTELMSDTDIIQRVLDHASAGTTDLGDDVWREPAEHYRCEKHLAQEIELFKRLPMLYCLSAALPEAGNYLARDFLGIPILAVRGRDGEVRAFYNSCRHRGMMLAEGAGKTATFVCPYHAWAYDLDGSLRKVNGEEGFPDVSPADHSLVPVTVQERAGLVFITLEEPIGPGALDGLPEIITPDQQVFEHTTFNDDANWKVLLETAMEGYHIKGLHGETFYPYGFDNLNLVETTGPNSRITFPFRRIEKLRDMPKEEWEALGRLTYVNQIFPNARVSILSNHYQIVIHEPVSPGVSRWIVWRLTMPGANLNEEELERAKRDASFVKDTGVLEDRWAARSIQNGLAGKGNTHFTFGRFEKAVVHFHQNWHAHLEKLGADR
jgi:choline monooxygenase